MKSDASIEELLSKLRPAKERYSESKRRLINEGGQGLIYKIKCKIDGKFYALKSFKQDFFKVGVDRIYKEEIFREIDNLRQLDHPHIAKIVDIVKDKNNIPSVVMELCNGTLQDLIDKKQAENTPEDEIVDIITSICKSL